VFEAVADAVVAPRFRNVAVVENMPTLGVNSGSADTGGGTASA
jgi:hypothetical protein